MTTYNDANRKNHEFDYTQEWERYTSNTATLKRFIKFFSVKNELFDTGIEFEVIPFEGFTPDKNDTNGKKAVGLVCGSCFVSSNLFPFRADTLHRSGAAHASPFIGAIPTGRITPKLMQLVYEGTIGRIIVCTTSFLNTDHDGTPSIATVIQVQEFRSCYMTFVDMTTYPYLTIFEFAYTMHILHVSDHDVTKSSQRLGQAVYWFDYGNGKGQLANPPAL